MPLKIKFTKPMFFSALAPRSGGIYHIRVRHSGQYIDVKNASAAVGTQAVQFNYNGGMNQQYRLLPYDGTYYQLEPVHAPGKVLAKSGTNDRLSLIHI